MSGSQSLERPLVSVVLEGYNQSREMGHARDTLTALLEQDYPLDRIEVILVGGSHEATDWRTSLHEMPFHDVRVLQLDGLNYYDLKNQGAGSARGDVVAFTDSDVQPRPTWVRSIVEGIEGGADVTVGPSLFGGSGRSPDTGIMIAAAAVTWGWICGKPGEGGLPRPRGFMDHNVAMRRSVAREFQYRTEFGRIIASPILFRALHRANKIVEMTPGQQAVHQFSWRYWLIGLEFRYGHEVYRLRRLDRDYPNQWLSKLGPLEPLGTMAWHLALDVPKWFRFNRVLKTSPLFRLACFPVFMALSLVARTAEMSGMYSTMLAPVRTQRWAENV